jgi:hypothetical protein
MTLYQCDRCGYNTSRRSNMNNHINKKKVCKALLMNIPIEIIRKQFINTNSSHNNNNDNNSNYNNNNNFNSCQYCNTEFKRKQNKYQHQKLHCPYRPSTINNNNNNNSYNTNCNNTNINNTNNNNIQINQYGSENRDYITKEFMMEIIKSPSTCANNLISKVHFNKNHMENANICITNKQSKFAYKCVGDDTWHFIDKNTLFWDLLLNNNTIVDTFIEEFKDEIPKKTRDIYDECMARRLFELKTQALKCETNILNWTSGMAHVYCKIKPITST